MPGKKSSVAIRTSVSNPGSNKKSRLKSKTVKTRGAAAAGPEGGNGSAGSTTQPPGAPPSWQPTGGTLATQVRHALEEYITSLNGEQPIHLYKLVLAEVERPLLEVVMRHVQGNHAKASKLLGMHRVTLCRRLTRYGLLQPNGTRRTNGQRQKA